MADNQTIVIDNGSCSFKIGFGGEECPKVTFSNMVGVLKYKSAIPNTKEIYIGDDAAKHAGMLNVFYPVENGSVTNWDHMDKILNLGFSELNVKAENYRVVISEPSNITKANRERMIQNMFETYKVQSYYSADQGVLNVFSNGLRTGISLDIGHELTQVVPVFDGHALEYAILCEYLAGKNITQFLIKLLSNKTHLINKPSDFLIAQEIKEKACFFSTEPNSEDIEYMMSDGSTIELSDECTTCTDLLFNPSLNNLDHLTRIDQLVYDSIMKIDLLNERDTFWEKIVVSGGTASMRGFNERFEKEMAEHSPPSRKISISYPFDPKVGAWSGGSILSGRNEG